MISHRTRGFTLIELLAGMAIFALISGSLYGAFGIAVRAFDSAGRRMDSEQQMRVVSGFLQRSLEQGFPLALVNRGNWRLQFEGDSRGLLYVANLPGYLGYGGLYEISFRSAREDGRLHLLLERRPLIIDKARRELRGELEKQVLMENLQDIRLRYYGISEGADSPRWQDQWRDARRLPLLVEMNITATEGAPWPPVVAQIRNNNIRFQMAAGSAEAAATGLIPPSGSAQAGQVVN